MTYERNYTTKSSSKKRQRRSSLRQRMIEDMQLNGLSPKTQERYIFGVQNLARYYKRSPDKISEEEVRSYFMHLKTKTSLSASTIRASKVPAIHDGPPSP
jgi:hypothetical protein